MIFVDKREITEHPEIPELINLECSVLLLDAGDYCFIDNAGEPTGIERSEISNFVMKLRSGELESQLLKCKKLLTEGVYDKYDELLSIYKGGNRGYFRNYIYPRTPYDVAKAAEISLSGMGIEVISSPNFGCSMDIVRLIYTNRTRKEGEHTLFKRVRKVEIPVKMSANPAVPRLMALVPHISEKAAIGLVYKFDSIWNIVHADDKELLEVDGVGKGLVKNMRESLGKP